MNIQKLDTPSLILDRMITEQNISRMHVHLEKFGVNLRPHCKTAKNIDVARMSLVGQEGGITVSTLKEAEYFFSHGIDDILYAVGIDPGKLDRVGALMRRGAKITLILDSMEQARELSKKGEALGITFPVLIEIDSDGHRGGVRPNDPDLMEIGRFLHGAGGSELRGVMTHAGESYHCDTPEQISRLAEIERDAVLTAAGQLRKVGLPSPVVSVGSTPTAVFAENLDGVTEVRPGNFVFYDLVMAGLRVCGIEDIAVSVLTSVIGRQKEKGWILCDAGWMALSRDRGTASQKLDQGYGLVCDIDGRVIEDLIVSGANQEHGTITYRDGSMPDWGKFPVGIRLRILPNHVCATSAMFDRYAVVEGSRTVKDTWYRINGW